MSSDQEKGKSVRINAESYEGLKDLQNEFAHQVGFVPSITQVIEYLVSKHLKGEKE